MGTSPVVVPEVFITGTFTGYHEVFCYGTDAQGGRGEGLGGVWFIGLM